jgi:hypothetical protein
MHFIYMAMMSMRTDRQLKGLPGAFSADVCSWTYSIVRFKASRPAALLGGDVSSLFGRTVSLH